MKRTYAPQEERKELSAGLERDPPQEALALDQQLPERSAGVLLSQVPAVPAARSLRQTAVRQMQQTHGNAHVQRELLSEVHRQQEDEEEEEEEAPVEAQAPTPATQTPTAEAEAPAPATQTPTAETQAPTAETEAPAPEAEIPTAEGEAPAAEAGQAPTTISGDGSTVSADASGVTIDGTRLSVNAAMVNINSAMVTTSGVLRTNTLMADNVVASTYTPGVGNVQ